MKRPHEIIKPLAMGALLLAATASSLSGLPREMPVGGFASFNPSPHVEEAYAFLEQGRSDEALASFNQALEQNEQDLPARLGQALIYSEQQRHAEAFAAYGQIVEAYPQHAFAWNGRGLAAFNMEDFDEALNSFEQATADLPMNGFFYESLTWTHMCRGEFPEAVRAAKQATLIYQQNGEHPAYPLLIAYFSSLEAGDLADATRTLRYAMKNKPVSRHWPTPVFDYLAGHIEQSELISFVTDSAQETEAHTYIGLHLRARGDLQAAEPHLNWVATKGDQRVFEHTLARVIHRTYEVAVK